MKQIQFKTLYILHHCWNLWPCLQLNDDKLWILVLSLRDFVVFYYQSEAASRFEMVWKTFTCFGWSDSEVALSLIWLHARITVPLKYMLCIIFKYAFAAVNDLKHSKAGCPQEFAFCQLHLLFPSFSQVFAAGGCHHTSQYGWCRWVMRIVCVLPNKVLWITAEHFNYGLNHTTEYFASHATCFFFFFFWGIFSVSKHAVMCHIFSMSAFLLALLPCSSL